jgi:signal recognition particle subunit SRP54
MLDNLTQRLAKVVKTLRGQARLTEDNIADMLREVRMALLEADVALPVVKELVSRIKEKASRPGSGRFAHARAGVGRRRA